MKKNKRRQNGTGRIRILYAVFLVLYSLFVLLDTFVIPRNIVRSSRGGGPAVTGKYEPVVTENSYDDGNIMIQIRTKRVADTTVYIADVKDMSSETVISTAVLPIRVIPTERIW